MDIFDIYEMLDSKNDIVTQNEGISLAINTKDIEPYILPMFPRYNKNVWENCAKILSTKTDEELTPYLAQLLGWLQDLNWPGTFIMMNRLKSFDGELLVKPYSKIVNMALKKEENNEWLDHLSKLLENEYLSKKMDVNLYNIMQERYANFWQI